VGAGEQISIQREDFDLAKEYAKLRVKIGNEVGAIVTFTGTVREQVFFRKYRRTNVYSTFRTLSRYDRGKY